MNTCPTCPNDLVCHDQGECLRPTPETDAHAMDWHRQGMVSTEGGAWVGVYLARRLERERNEARELLASEKSTRNAIIAKGIETERQLAEAREENARLREAINQAHKVLCCYDIAECDLDEFEELVITITNNDLRSLRNTLATLEPLLTP